MNTSTLINDIEETENLLLSNPSSSSSSPPNHEYPQQQIDKHRQQFEQWIQTKYIDNNKTTYVMRKAEYDQIKDVLSGVRTIKDANQRHKFNKKVKIVFYDYFSLSFYSLFYSILLYFYFSMLYTN